jgi:hypothetical protein
MAAKKKFFGFIDAGREIRRPPLVGMQFLHQRAVSARDRLSARTSFQAKDLIGLLLRHFSGASRTPPRRRVLLRVFTPTGVPAVKISHQ